LGVELLAVVDGVAGLPPATMTRLRDLATRLSSPPVDAAGVDGEVRSAVEVLGPLAGQPTRRGRPFWKR